MADLKNITVAILATDFFEEKELTSPKGALEACGALVEVIAPHSGTIKGLKHIKAGKSVKVDKTLTVAKPSDYDALIIPGGAINSDHLRMDELARKFVSNFMKSNKLTAIICHGPWLLVSAKLAKGRKLTSYFTIQDDIRNAGGKWENESVVRDKNLITSRNPDDLPRFNAAIINALSGT